MRRRIKVSGIGMVALALASAILAGSAQAATVSLTPVRTVPMGFTSTTNYTVASDGTIWAVQGTGTNSGTVWHVDNEGNSLAGGFSISRGGFYPLGIGYYGGRVYVSTAASFGGTTLLSYSVAEPAVAPSFSDFETQERTGSLGMYFRIGANGVATVAMGQGNKIATMDVANVAGEHPYYSQIFMGAGINASYNPSGNAFESCSAGGGSPEGEAGTPANCGHGSGYTPEQNGSDGFSYPIDVAPGVEGLYVAEKDGNRIAHVHTGADGPDIDFKFGSGPGTGAGQLSEPFSIVRQASTGDLFVSEQGNRRISVFNSAGGYVASFGYGVHDGADTFEACGVEIGSCQAGVAYTADSRSYFTRLDLGPEGNLYAYMPLAGAIQVFSLGETQTTSGGSNPGSAGTAGGVGNPGGATGTNNPLKCHKGFKKKTVHGKPKCVKAKRKHHQHHRHGGH